MCTKKKSNNMAYPKRELQNLFFPFELKKQKIIFPRNFFHVYKQKKRQKQNEDFQCVFSYTMR